MGSPWPNELEKAALIALLCIILGIGAIICIDVYFINPGGKPLPKKEVACGVKENRQE